MIVLIKILFNNNNYYKYSVKNIINEFIIIFLILKNY